VTQANDSILVTPGTGATVATHLINSKEHQVVVLATESGLIYGSEQIYIYSTGNTANVAAARTTFFDLFNATGSGVVVEIYGIYIIPALAAVTGIGNTWELAWSSTVGSGGTTLTGTKADQSNAAVNANVTARTKPTGGATIGSVLQYINGSSEETSPYAGMASILNHVDWCGAGAGPLQPITIREGQGIKIDQTTNSAVGTTNIMVITAQHAPPP
jgi:hypothetical protein